MGREIKGRCEGGSEVGKWKAGEELEEIKRRKVHEKGRDVGRKGNGEDEN